MKTRLAKSCYNKLDMAQYLVTGGNPLKGKVHISGNKNSILSLLPATIVASGPVTLTNVPIISDVAVACEILETVGATVSGVGTSTLTIDPTKAKPTPIPASLSRKVRSSIMFLAPLLARFGQVSLGFPGGDTIGKRAVGTHFDALSAFGAKFTVKAEDIVGHIPNPTQGDVNIFLDEASVTATENALIMAASHPATTIIKNAAREPHVVNLGKFLTKLGAEISGLGTNDIVIRGTKNLGSANHEVSFDYMDAGTFAVASAVTGGHITMSPVNQEDMHMILLYLSRFNVKYKWPQPDTLEILPSELKVDPEKLASRQKFQTNIWPGFPTDLMSPLIVLATQAAGTVLMHDWMYETRMFFTDKLVSMGANITLCDPHRVIVTGPTPLVARHTASPDIRAGMSILIATLCAEGVSTIDHAETIERGYEDPVKRLTALGAKIKRSDTHD